MDSNPALLLPVLNAVWLHAPGAIEKHRVAGRNQLILEFFARVEKAAHAAAMTTSDIGDANL
jgi:hypothetical protein